MPKYSGRLELTWTNKDLALLAHEDGSYEWVNPADYRVAEVRLLHDVSTVGQVGKTRAGDNLLIRGDALNALTSLSRLPELAHEYLGKVKLVYIDPPFNTQQSFLQYDDALEHSVWLTMIRDRLLQIRDLLAPNGSVWLHLDDSEVHRARVVLDEVFGPDQFVATVVWEKSDSPRMDAQYFSLKARPSAQPAPSCDLNFSQQRMIVSVEAGGDQRNVANVAETVERRVDRVAACGGHQH